MSQVISDFKGKFRLAVLSLLVFTLAATSQVALAESQSFVSCNNNGNNSIIKTVLQFGQYQSQTINNSAGCTWLQVRLRKWLTTTFITEVSATDTTNGYTSWVGLSANSTYTYVAKHSLQDRRPTPPSPTFSGFTSDTGGHSSGNWFCSGSSSGSSGC